MYLYDARLVKHPCNWVQISVFVIHFNVFLSYIIDCVAAQKLHVFMQSRPVLDRQKKVLHRNKCDNLMQTLRSCFSHNILTS